MNTLQTIEQMRQSPYVKEKKLQNGISSFNFTHKAFWNSHWTNATVKARGLFIDTVNGKIKARSYNKFFTIGERRETELDILAENFEYPVKAYVKYNGYLGICSGEKDEKGEYCLWCASKSTDQGWYAARFEDLLRESLDGKCEYSDETRYQRFARDLYESCCTAVFEVIDPIQDPHIIGYDRPQVILLDLIINDDEDIDMLTKSREVVEFYNATWKLPLKELAYIIHNAEELYHWYNLVTGFDYTYDGQHIEGFVLEDLDCHMVKVKTAYYLYWKSFRPVIHKIFKGEWGTGNTAELVQKNVERYHLDPNLYDNVDNFINWLIDKWWHGEPEPSIVEARYKYLEECNDDLLY